MIKYKNIPVQCDPSKMSYWEQFLYSLSNKEIYGIYGTKKLLIVFLGATDECKEYYNMLMKEEFWSVSPFIVLSEQFKILIKTPIITIGHALSEMLALMMSKLMKLEFINVFLTNSLQQAFLGIQISFLPQCC